MQNGVIFMTTAICELWNGNIAPVEHCGAHDEVANLLSSMIERNRESLLIELTAEQKLLFQKYIDCSEEYLLRMMELSFCDGFRIGGRLIMEIGSNI